MLSYTFKSQYVAMVMWPDQTSMGLYKSTPFFKLVRALSGFSQEGTQWICKNERKYLFLEQFRLLPQKTSDN